MAAVWPPPPPPLTELPRIGAATLSACSSPFKSSLKTLTNRPKTSFFSTTDRWKRLGSSWLKPERACPPQPVASERVHGRVPPTPPALAGTPCFQYSESVIATVHPLWVAFSPNTAPTSDTLRVPDANRNSTSCDDQIDWRELSHPLVAAVAALGASPDDPTKEPMQLLVTILQLMPRHDEQGAIKLCCPLVRRLPPNQPMPSMYLLIVANRFVLSRLIPFSMGLIITSEN